MSLANDDLLALIPHRPPMVMLDSVDCHAPDSCCGRKTFRPGDFGVDGHRVSEPILIECLAQLVAAMQGYQSRRDGDPPRGGMLVKVGNFDFHKSVFTGERLELSVAIKHQLASLVAAHGEIVCNGRKVAEGELHFHISAKPSPT